MKKISILVLTVLLVFFAFMNSKADSEDENFEKVFADIGYKEVSVAVQESKDHFRRYLSLPTRLPAVAFTHNFARLSDLKGKENDEFEIKFINKEIPENHYMIRIKPIEYALEFKEEHINQKLQLSSGKDALFISTELLGFNFLVFEKDGWQYTLSVDNRISDKVTPEVLVDIANSIN